MKNLFLNMGSGVQARNFTQGDISYRKLSADEVRELLITTEKEGAEIKAYFDFGAEPSNKKKEREFGQLLKAFGQFTKSELKSEYFFSNRDGGDEFYPNFNFIPMVSDKISMIAVEYYFTMDEDSLFSDTNRNFFDVADNMDFHFFEKISSE